MFGVETEGMGVGRVVRSLVLNKKVLVNVEYQADSVPHVTLQDESGQVA